MNSVIESYTVAIPGHPTVEANLLVVHNSFNGSADRGANFTWELRKTSPDDEPEDCLDNAGIHVCGGTFNMNSTQYANWPGSGTDASYIIPLVAASIPGIVLKSP